MRSRRPQIETLEDRRLLSAVIGTLIGTTTSYANQGNIAANAFDGNLNTFFDGPDASGDWAGLNLGAPVVINEVQYAPRTAYASRMMGGVFQGSSSAAFTTGVVNLFTITIAPVYGALTAEPITNTAALQYVRYIGPASGYCDVAELQFDSAAVAPAALPFTGSGTAGSYNNLSTGTVSSAFDGNLNTYFDGPTANGNYVQAAFSSEANITAIQYAPRAGYPNRMVGGVFQGSNSALFSNAVNLFTITVAPAAGVLTTSPISTAAAYEYVRYISPAGSYGNIAEMAFVGTLTGTLAAILNPTVTSSSPANNATGISPTAFVSCALNLPNGAGVNPDTLTTSTVYLYRTFDQTMIPTEVNTDAAGSVIVLQPQSPLAAYTQYTFVVTAGVTDTTAAPFTPYTISFTTGAQTAPTNSKIAFTKVSLPTATGQYFSGLTMGPDGNLYACTVTGIIDQFPVNPDGTLGNPVNIAALANMPARLITGVAFDPSSTPNHMILWISSGNIAESNAPDFSGTIGAFTISGGYVSPYQNYVINLPRSNSNHLNDQPVFGPDGALYWCQGSNTSMGAPDSVWGYRPEHLLNAAILRLNIQLIEQYVAANNQPLNVQTDTLAAGQTAYNPYAAGAPLTLYATGIRNAYDLIWDTNGHLYAPTNGSAAGGNIPGTPAGVTPAAPAENNVAQAENDYLYDIVQGGYYGHPDPARGQYIFGGGNPVDPAPDTAIQDAYPLGTLPDPNYRGYVFDFGVHYSPDGSIEYQGSAFGGALNGALLITEYSGGKDVLALTTGSSGQITGSETGIAGFTGYADPVSIIENQTSGDLYVADLGTETITLLRPLSSGATISVSSSTLYFDAAVNGAASPAQTITITNTGAQPLAIPATGLFGSGTDASLFPIANGPQLPAIIAPGASITLGIVFNPGTSALGLHTAQLEIASNDSVNPLVVVNLRALTTAGIGGSDEPSLAAILNLYQIPDNVGTANAAQSYFTFPPQSPTDEVGMPELEKAGTGPVTITPIAAFDADITPAVNFGYYPAGSPTNLNQLFTLAAASSQTVDPAAIGSTSFDPGSLVFGLYAASDAILNSANGTARINTSEYPFNSYDTVNHYKIRFYPLKTSNGTVVANSYVFAVDDGAALPLYQFNNFVGIITNVKAAASAPVIGTQNVAGGDNESAPSPTQFVFSSAANANGSAPSMSHATADLRIDNGGTLPLVISGINSSNAFFMVAGSLTFPLTIAVGGYTDLTLDYKPVHTTGANAQDSGVLTIDSNDPVHPAFAVQLSGIWQAAPVAADSPTLPAIVAALGYKTVITNTGQSLNQNGEVTAVGQEVLSPYWTRADANLPVTVQQLAAYSGKTTGSALYWYTKGQSSDNSIVSIPGDDTDSLLPVENDATAAASIGMFTASGIFGFTVDKSVFSDNTLNTAGGHQMRFWPVYNSAGQLVPNTWLMAMDYPGAAEAFTYTSNVYLISNMKPAAPAVPTAVTAATSITGITVSWTAVSDPLLSGYLLYRSSASSSTYSEIGGGMIAGTTFIDTTAAPGTKYYYIVAAEDSFGSISAFTSNVSATRPTNAVAPAVPANLTNAVSSAGITLSWSADTASDLAGYDVYRSTSATGTYYLLNSALLTTPTFADTSAAAGIPSFYRVTAVNQSATASGAATITATRPSTVLAPGNLIATGSVAGIALAWNASTAASLVGYDLWRSNSTTGVFTQINAAPLTTLIYLDTTAPLDQTSYYRLTAVTTAAADSSPVTASAFHPDNIPPAMPTGFTANASGAAITLTWKANTEPDLAGYILLRSAAAAGAFSKLNTALLTATTYTDIPAIVGTWYYELIAVDTSGNDSPPAVASAMG